METIYLQSILTEIKQNHYLKGQLDGISIPESKQFSPALFELAGKLASGGLKEEGEHLISIFSKARIKNEAAPKLQYFRKKPMVFSKAFFPSDTPSNDAKELNGFGNELKLISKENPKIYAESLLFLLQKYGVGLPSPAGADVAFYDYVKVKAGLSICLHQFEDSVLLIGGGVSGIQNYLYDIIRRKAAINLKGRSFYLQLLIDEVVQYVLNELNLFQANILYASGGNFYLIAPGNLGDKVKSVEKIITEKLFNEYKTGIRLELAGVEMTHDNIEKQPGKYWPELGLEINKRKFQPFRYLLDTSVILEDGQNGFKYFFSPQEVGGETLRDAITNEEISNPKLSEPLENGSNLLVLPSTKQQARLGQQLKKADFLIINGAQGNENIDPAKLGIHYIVGEKLKEHMLLKDSQVYTINDLNFIKSGIKGIQGFKLFGGNEAPVFKTDDPSDNKAYKKGELKSFEHLADGVDGFVRLGFLRMDVDDLGLTLGEASNESGNSLSRLSTLSRSLDFFFKGYLNYLWKQSESFSEYSQIIYAGGDDLFIVGRWDVMIELAQQIRDDFNEWVAFHPGISLSGGLAMVTPKFPISKAAAMAGDAEDASKEYEYNNDNYAYKKNAFTLLGVPLHWDLDMPIVKELKNDLVRFLSAKEIPKSVLMNIQRFYQQKLFQKEHKIAESWRWQTAYMFARAGDRIKKNHLDARSFLKDLSVKIFANSANGKEALKSKHDFFDLLNIAARWAELELRIDK